MAMVVKANIAFSLEYVIDTEFYVPGDAEASLEMERGIVADTPAEMVALFGSKGLGYFTTSVEFSKPAGQV